MRQSFAWWSFVYGHDIDGAQLLRAAADVGYEGVEMLPEALDREARQAGLAIVTDSAHDIEMGFNERLNHPALERRVLARSARQWKGGSST